jgi:hypothetical protein
MGTYQSKFTGEEIDGLLEEVRNGGGSSSSSGMKKTTLFEGSLNTTGGIADLSDSVLNYDELRITGSCDIKANSSIDCCRADRTILVDDIMFMDETGNESGTYNIYESNNSGNYHRECFGFNNATQVKMLVASNGGTWSNAKISKIVGIKY